MRAVLLLLASLLASCTGGGVRPFTYTDNKEMAGRPGLFSGPSGQFEVYRR